MKVKSKELVSDVLKKFIRISKLAQSYASDSPVWSSIIFDAETPRLLYIGWKFQVEAPYPEVEGEPLSFIVNFERFFNAMKLSKNPTLSLKGDSLVIESDRTKWELRNLDLDYSNHLLVVPEQLDRKPMPENLRRDIQFCMLAAEKDRMEYTKHGVVLATEMMFAMDTNSAIALVDINGLVETPVLLHYPWCQVIDEVGEIVTIAQEDLGQQSANMYLELDNGFHLSIPTLKMHPNPSIKPYVESFEPHYDILVNEGYVKRLAITTDNAYQFATVFSENGELFMESNSNTKGRTVIPIGEGTMSGESATVSLKFLKNVANISGKLKLDMDNMVGFTTVDSLNYLYAFGLG